MLNAEHQILRIITLSVTISICITLNLRLQEFQYIWYNHFWCNHFWRNHFHVYNYIFESYGIWVYLGELHLASVLQYWWLWVEELSVLNLITRLRARLLCPARCVAASVFVSYFRRYCWLHVLLHSETHKESCGRRCRFHPWFVLQRFPISTCPVHLKTVLCALITIYPLQPGAVVCPLVAGFYLHLVAVVCSSVATVVSNLKDEFNRSFNFQFGCYTHRRAPSSSIIPLASMLCLNINIQFPIEISISGCGVLNNAPWSKRKCRQMRISNIKRWQSCAWVWEHDTNP